MGELFGQTTSSGSWRANAQFDVVLVAASNGRCPLRLVALNSCREADHQNPTPTANAAASHQDFFADWPSFRLAPAASYASAHAESYWRLFPIAVHTTFAWFATTLPACPMKLSLGRRSNPPQRGSQRLLSRQRRRWPKSRDPSEVHRENFEAYRHVRRTRSKATPMSL
jgi:hypothetical protein